MNSNCSMPEACPEHVHQLYTKKPSFVGLSDAERLELFYKYVGESTMGYPLCDLDWINYAAAVEMKLREKNGL
jgi:hypothetical protein